MKKSLGIIFLLFFAFSAYAQNAPQAPIEEGAKIAYFGVHFIDTSTEGAYNGVREDEAQRIEMFQQKVRERMEAEGFEILDNAPVQEELDRIVDPANCYGCDLRMGEKLGADYVLVGQVQKVSNLILSMNLQLRKVPEGEMARGLAVDIRSNTDESWLRGMNYIFDNNFFAEEN